MRKSAKMKTLLESANAMLMNPELSQEMKKGVAMMLEVALEDSGSYSGYNFYKADGSLGGTLLESLHEGKEVEGYEYWTRLYWAPKGGF